MSTTTKNPDRGIALAAVMTAIVACGVQDHPHEQAAYDPNADLGATSGAGGAGAITTGPATTGTTVGTTGSSATTGSGTTGSGTTGSSTAATGSGGAGPMVDASPTGVGGGGLIDAQTLLDAPIVRDAGTPSGITVNIGGTNVAKEDIIAFIMLGHSNMAGRATGPASEAPYNLTITDPHAWMYHVGMPVQPALEPHTAGDGGCTACGGPGTPLMKQAAAAAPGKYFVDLGFGQNSAYCSQFLPGALYYNSVIAAPKAMKGRVTFGAIVIMLGITERHGTAADINGYPNCINQLVTSIRTDVGEPNLPLLITDYEMEATSPLEPTSAYALQIIPQIHKIPTTVSNSVLVPTNGTGMQDDHHFNFSGHKLWTGRVVQLMKDNGWFPWAP